MTRHTDQQKEKAKAARKPCHTMGVPTIGNFKYIIKSNQIKNCPVTLDDIDGAEKSHGNDILCIEGKPMRQNPTTTTIVNITTPKELKERNKNITPCIDIVCINEIGFVTTMSHPLHSRGHKHIKQHKRFILQHNH